MISTLKQTKSLTRLPANCLIQFPSKVWGFVGSVAPILCYTLDGELVTTDEQIELVSTYRGIPHQKRVKARVWETREEAQAEAMRCGLDVTLPS